MQKYTIRCTTLTPILGSAPLDGDIYTRFVASKAPAAVAAHGNGAVMADELERLEEVDAKGRTGFLRNEDGRPCLADYQVKGFLKEAWRACKGIPASESKELKTGVAAIERYVHLEPRFIPLHVGANGGSLDIMERPLRAQTAQGPRVALASSERMPTGTRFEFQVVVLAIVSQTLLTEWLEYGQWQGLGQWRNGGHGRFSARIIPWKDA